VQKYWRFIWIKQMKSLNRTHPMAAMNRQRHQLANNAISLKLNRLAHKWVANFFGEIYEHDALHGVACDEPTMEPFDFYGGTSHLG
jgi:hypothetical protein